MIQDHYVRTAQGWTGDCIAVEFCKISCAVKYIYVRSVLPTQSIIMSIVLNCRAVFPEIEQEFSHRAQTRDHPFLFQPQKSCTVTGALDRLSAENLHRRPQASAHSQNPVSYLLRREKILVAQLFSVALKLVTKEIILPTRHI